MTIPLRLIVESVQGDHVRVKAPDGIAMPNGAEWTLPASAIYGVAKPGMELRLLAAAAGAEDAGKTELAHALLNELLGKPNA